MSTLNLVRGASLALILLLGSFAGASTIYVQTTPVGATTIPGLVGSTVIDFEGVPAGTYSTITLAGVTFTPDGSNLMWIDSAFAGQYNNFGLSSLHNNYDSKSFNVLTIQFATTTSGFGFFWGASDDQWTLTAYDSSNNVIESYLLPITHGSNAGDFVGILDPGIAWATLSGNSGDYIFMDNFEYNSIPEPGTLFLLGTSLAGLVGVCRRRIGL